MHVLGILLVGLQLICAVHAVKTGRAYWWLWIILFLPGIGAVVYFLTEVLPDLQRNSALQQVGLDLVTIVNPGRSLQRLEAEREVCDNVKNRQALARGYMNAGRYEEALALYQQCLTGVFKDDPAVLLELAYAHFLRGQYDEVKTTIERLRQVNESFHREERELMLARTLEESGELKQALERYAAMVRSSSGEEIRFRYAQLLERSGEIDSARQLYQEILARARRSPRYYRRAQRLWIGLAKQRLAQPPPSEPKS